MENNNKNFKIQKEKKKEQSLCGSQIMNAGKSKHMIPEPPRHLVRALSLDQDTTEGITQAGTRHSREFAFKRN